jgi:hypothetical protein
MKRIYEAANAIEAHMIVHLLGQAGIEGRVEGEYLQGGVGELPAVGLVGVAVPEEQAERARAIVLEWERTAPPPDAQVGARPNAARDLGVFAFGVLVGGVLTWLVCR